MRATLHCRSRSPAALLLAPGGAIAQADPNKVLHVSFPIAETGFDPQAINDLYSNYVNRAIFEALYRYDHFARPYKVVPNTAAALPEASADGKTWTIRVKPGIYFTDDPAFKGKKRELVAADYVYSWKRILDPKMRSPHLDDFDGKFVGDGRAGREGQGDRQVRLRRAARRPAGRRQVHAAHQAQLSVVRHPAEPDDDGVLRGRPRSDRGVRRRQRLGDGESGRHRPVPAEGLAARPEDRARGQCRLPRRALSGKQRSGRPPRDGDC